MDCGPEVAGGVYHPRQPEQTPFYRLVQRFYPEFEAVYPERYQERYGFYGAEGSVPRLLNSSPFASPAITLIKPLSQVPAIVP